MFRRAFAALCCLLILEALGGGQVGAAGKKRPATQAPPFNGKRVIALAPVRNVRIEMPDQKFHDFGRDFKDGLGNRLTNSGRYIEADPPLIQNLSSALRSVPDEELPPGYEWPGSVVPAATVKIKVEALSFQTGSRGERMFYGFNERYRTPFNNGYDSRPNEFPLRPDSRAPSWFGHTFDEKGFGPVGSRAGLDLGDGLNINVLFAWLAVKYALYHSELRLHMSIEAPLAGRNEYRIVQVTGEGFFFDIAGAYVGYSGGIQVARRDAMDQALKNAINGAYDAVDRALSDLPLVARIDSIMPDGSLLLGTGRNSDIKAGVRYGVQGHPDVLVEVVSSSSSGSTAKLAQGAAEFAKVGALLIEAANGGDVSPISMTAMKLSASDQPTAKPLAAVETITLPWTNLAQSNLDGLAPVVSWLAAFTKSLAELVVLPYRVWRYFSYDQLYRTFADHFGFEDGVTWAERVRGEAWASQIHLQDGVRSLASAKDPITVAVLDSGVDYNHQAIHDNLWLNPAPQAVDGGGLSTRMDRYGWDFVSGDSHPYDDGYHGTEVSSLITAVAPEVRIMPLKIFNPWGITSSAAIWGAFKYAVDHQAKIILCAWATPMRSQAIEEGVAYARDHGVLVVAAAGDQGEQLSEVPAYPAVLSAKFDNVLTVTSVSPDDRLVERQRGGANWDPQLVGISAPGERLMVANPRSARDRVTSTGLAAALTTGALARLIAADTSIDALGRKHRPSEWIRKIREDADMVPALVPSVNGGLRLHVRQ